VRRNLTAVAVVALTFLLGTGVTPAWATHTDIEPNDTCATAAPAPPPYSTGSLTGADVTDVYRFGAAPNQRISVEMNPGYQSGSNFDLVLHGPACNPLDTSTNSGTSIEYADAVAPVGGTYYAEVKRITGSGLYDIRISVSTQGFDSCGGTGLTLVATCGVDSPVCGSGSCTYRVTITAEDRPGHRDDARRQLFGGAQL